jgi:hypothetical protein
VTPTQIFIARARSEDGGECEYIQTGEIAAARPQLSRPAARLSYCLGILDAAKIAERFGGQRQCRQDRRYVGATSEHFATFDGTLGAGEERIDVLIER